MTEITYPEIIEIFESDMFDNDVHDKVEYIMRPSNECRLGYDELLEIYDNMR